jgi:hypothetical protein
MKKINNFILISCAFLCFSSPVRSHALPEIKIHVVINYNLSTSGMEGFLAEIMGTANHIFTNHGIANISVSWETITNEANQIHGGDDMIAVQTEFQRKYPMRKWNNGIDIAMIVSELSNPIDPVSHALGSAGERVGSICPSEWANSIRPNTPHIAIGLKNTTSHTYINGTSRQTKVILHEIAHVLGAHHTFEPKWGSNLDEWLDCWDGRKMIQYTDCFVFGEECPIRECDGCKDPNVRGTIMSYRDHGTNPIGVDLKFSQDEIDIMIATLKGCGKWPCIDDAVIPYGIQLSTEFKAANTLQCGTKILLDNPYNGFVEFKSNNKIILKPGFIVDGSNSRFKASIGEGCSAILKSEKIVFNTNKTNPNNTQLVSITKQNNQSVNISPNPTKGNFNINGIKGYYSYSIINLNGSLIASENNLTGSKEVSLSLQPSGIYILQIRLENEVIYRTKIIKQ